jgi:hypothetical protein
MDHLSRWMQFDLIVKWMKNFDLKTGQGSRSVWQQGREPPGPLELAPNRKFQFCSKQDVSICLDGKGKLCGPKNLVLLDDYCYVKRREACTERLHGRRLAPTSPNTLQPLEMKSGLQARRA